MRPRPGIKILGVDRPIGLIRQLVGGLECPDGGEDGRPVDRCPQRGRRESSVALALARCHAGTRRVEHGADQIGVQLQTLLDVLDLVFVDACRGSLGYVPAIAVLIAGVDPPP